jgi:alkylhydroperoxidase/carboxymuconolactone decarboxylase family protein YurZ
MQQAQEMLRRLTIGSSGWVAAVADPDRDAPGWYRLDDRTEALLQIGALVALDAPQSSYQEAVGAAQRAGADLDDILAVLIAVAASVGSARVVAAAPKIALAAGYDIEAALEVNDPSDHGARRPSAQP